MSASPRSQPGPFPAAPPPLDPATAPPPVEPKAPPPGRKFPCQKCGAQLDFDPASRALKCPYCGFTEVIEPSSHAVQERDWDAYWQHQSDNQCVLQGRSSQVACAACGAVVLIEDRLATDKCPFCGAFLENQPEAAQAMIPPEGIMPFAISEPQAREAFNRWVVGRWFAPGPFYQFANLGKLNGVYVPFWTYDAMTYTHYTGERGDDYTETETYTENDANGQPVTKTREVTKTRWTHVSGEVRHFFDDVLICASKSVPESRVAKLGPWDLKQLEPMQPQFLSGFQAERYAIGLKDGFDRAKSIMEAAIRSLCEQDIGGNHQRLHSVQTQYMGITFKHILLPLWTAAYRYQDRPYQVLINGRTGKVSGARPFSWQKITMLVLIILAVLLAIFVIVALAQSMGRHGERGPEPGRQEWAGLHVPASGGRKPPVKPFSSPVAPTGGSRPPLAGTNARDKRTGLGALQVQTAHEGRYRMAG